MSKSDFRRLCIDKCLGLIAFCLHIYLPWETMLEHPWSHSMQLQVYQKMILNSTDGNLHCGIQREWENIPQIHIGKLVHTMRKRSQHCCGKLFHCCLMPRCKSAVVKFALCLYSRLASSCGFVDVQILFLRAQMDCRMWQDQGTGQCSVCEGHFFWHSVVSHLVHVQSTVHSESSPCCGLCFWRVKATHGQNVSVIYIFIHNYYMWRVNYLG